MFATLYRSCYNSQMAVITTHSTADDGVGKVVEDALENRESDELELVKQMAIL